MSIRAQLFFVIFIVALPAAGIMAYTSIRLHDEALNEAQKVTERLVERIAVEQQNLVNGAEQLMTALAELPEVKQHDAARVEPILRRLVKLNTSYSNIFIADKSGDVWATAVPVKHPFNVADRQYFQNAMARGQLSSGEYIISRAISKPTINFSYPVKNDRDEITGIISVGFNVSRYWKILDRLQYPAGTSFVLIDNKGTILYRALNPEQFIGKSYTPKAFKQMLEGPEIGTSLRKGLVGDKRIISFKKIRINGEHAAYMYVTAGIPLKVALKQANQSLVYSIAVFSTIIVAAFFIAWIIGKRSILDRVALLERASQRLAKGELDVSVSDLVVGGELGSLARTFDNMAHDLALREKTLRESGRFLSTIIEAEPEAVNLLAHDGSILMTNRAGLDMMQLDSFDKIKGKSAFTFIDPAYHEAFRTLNEYVFNGNTGHLVFKFVGTKGRSLWLETHAAPLKNDKGEIVSLLAITRNITERKEMDRMKDEMISAVSHEMRTPLTAMLGYIQFIMENDVDEAKTKEYLGTVNKQAERLKELIDNFLDLQRLREKRGFRNLKQLAVRPLLEEAANLIADPSNLHRIKIDASSELPPIICDEEGIHSVFNNLLSNAVKYSPNGGDIVLGARQEANNVTMWVKDEGIGIPQELLDKIFDRFYRVDNTDRRTTSGTGLGLSLVKEIVTAQGGGIWIESTLGKGSTVYITLPAADSD